MEKRLRPIALHLFSKFGSTFAFEPQRLNLFQVSPLIHEILQNAGILTDADGSSPGSLDKPFVPKNQKTGMDRLVLFSSHRCNLRCKYCFNNDSESP
jgi:sulfatase maturation enzyme AslB (radical SAM superfamily)